MSNSDADTPTREQGWLSRAWSNIRGERQDETAQSEDGGDGTLTVAFDKDIRPFIDIIDELRRLGLEQDIGLPSIVVVGDQSSGKSSILEAISGVQLPRGRGIVTRCPLEMQLKRVSTSYWRAKISYTDALGHIEEIRCESPEDVDQQISEAQNRIAGLSKEISTKVITLRVESPTAPDLTLIDLPGIARTAVEGQSRDVMTKIKGLIQGYISKSNTIILCVISANLDIAVNEAIYLAQQVDADGSRTLGVITKPDLVEDIAKHEVLDLLNNTKVKLLKGFSMVKCRSLRELESRMPLETALDNEAYFFESDPVYRTANPRQLGMSNLAKRLTEQLVELIRVEIPRLKQDVKDAYEQAKQEVEVIPSGPPENDAQKLGFLYKIMSEFESRLKKCLIHGENVPTPNRSSTQKNIFYDWRLHFNKFENELTSLTDIAMTSQNGALSDAVIAESLSLQRGRELHGFINYDLFELLIRNHLVLYRQPADICLREVSKNLNENMQRHVEDFFKNFPELRKDMLQMVEKVRQKQVEDAQVLIKGFFDQEDLVYTQDSTFIEKFDSIEQTERMKASNSHEAQVIAFETSKLPEKTRNAQNMHKLLRCYLNVANRRLSDIVPCCIRLKLHSNFLDQLSERIQHYISQPSVVARVQETPAVAEKRMLMQRKTDRLNQAMLKLACF